MSFSRNAPSPRPSPPGGEGGVRDRFPVFLCLDSRNADLPALRYANTRRPAGFPFPSGERARGRGSARQRSIRLPFLLLCLTGLSFSTASAAAPEVASVLPKGGTIGGAYTLVLKGEFLDGSLGLTWYDDGIVTLGMETVGENKERHTEARIRIEGGCRLGEHAFRLRTAGGFSELATFFVGSLPDAAEAEPNNDYAEAQEIPLNVTVSGVIRNEDVDFYRIHAEKGQRISAELEGVRLGVDMFDPYLAILDTNRFELAARDDGPLLAQDPWFSILAPETGDYVIEVRETAYRGGDNAQYRLHVGTFARPTALYPAGGPAGATIELTVINAAGDPVTESRTLPATPGEHLVFVPAEAPAPSPMPIRVSPFPNLLEVEPNNRWQEPSVGEPAAPIACNGIIGADDDIDWFAFTAVKDQELDVQVFARRLRSPLDPVVQVRQADGKQIKANDDEGGPDSVVRFRVPEDGRYLVSVRDHLNRGGPDYVYRVEITPVVPSLTVKLPEFDRNRPQKRQAVVVPRGNRFALPFLVQRENFDGPVNLEVGPLPEGVTAIIPPIDFSTPQVPVIFEATTNAPLAGMLTRIDGVQTADGRTVRGPYRQPVTLVKGNPNNAVYHTYDADRIAVAVTEEAPFSLRIEPPAIPLIHGGSLPLQVVAESRDGWQETIRLKMLYNPAGITSSPEVKLDKGATRAEYRINAVSEAREGLFPLAVAGWATVDGGEVWVSTPFVDIEVTAPWVRGAIDLMTVEQGGEGQVVCSLEMLKPFDGEARMRLMGLPPKTSAEEVVITRDSTEAVFRVRAEPDSKTGKHESLFAAIDVPYGDTVIPHTVGAFGTLRIDPPPRNEPEPAPVAEAEPEKKTERQLSRLETLRQEQERRLHASGDTGT